MSRWLNGEVAGATRSEREPKPLAIDLFCGLGGWAEGFLAEGYQVIGFDIERRPYPGSLVLQDALTLHGSQFKDAAVIVASPPCQAYSYRAMPWKRAKALPPPSNELFDACFRIQREASEAAGRFIPMVVENVRGAEKWVGRARWHYGSFYLWGDLPALMPFTSGAGKVPGLAHGTFPGGGLAQGAIDNALKVPGINWNGYGKPGYKPQGFNVTAAQRFREGQKVPVYSDPRRNGGKGSHLTSPRENADRLDGNKGFAKRFEDTPMARLSSKSDSRKAASAQIAKIPFPLAQHIARVYKPEAVTRRTDRQHEACR